MGIGLRAFVLATCLMASPAFAADQQFDLICTSPNGSAHYRIDLDRGEVCEDVCDRVRKIAEATSGELTLTKTMPTYRNDLEEVSMVNRSTGAWHYHNALGGRVYTREGRCERAPFSGFPVAKF